jgi:hypothetical protein
VFSSGIGGNAVTNTNKNIAVYFGVGLPDGIPADSLYIRLDNEEDPEYGLSRYDDDENPIDMKLVYHQFQEWSETPFGDRRATLRESWMYDNVFSLWWCVDHRDWLINSLPLFKRSSRLVNLARNQPCKKWVITSKSQHEWLIREVARAHRIPFEPPGGGRRTYRSVRNAMVFFAVQCFLFMGWRIRRLLGRRRKIKKSDLLISSISSLWGKVWDPAKQTTVTGDGLYDTILSELQRRHIDFCYTDYLSHLGLKIRVLAGKRKKYANEYTPLESFLTMPRFNKAQRNAWTYVKALAKWKRQPEFQSVFSFRNISLWPWYERWLDKIVHQYLPFACFYAECMESLQENVQPRVLLHTPEAGFYGRIFSAVSHKNRVKSVGLNHAFAYRQNPSLLHKDVDMSRSDNLIGSYRCPIADMTLILGELDEVAYIEDGKYPAGQLMKVGAPRFDAIIHTKADDERRRFRSQVKIEMTEFAVMFAAQPAHRVYDDAALYWRDIAALCRAIKEINGTLVVRPHPQESRQYFGRYRSVADSVGLEKIMVIKDWNLFQMLWGCDCSCTISSNVVYESIIAFRPSFYLRTNDPIEPFGLLLDKMIKELPVARKQSELQDMLLRIKNDRSFTEDFLDFRNRKVGRLVYNIDGTATARVLDYLEDLFQAR